jgi:hypothetical protein
MTDLIEPRPYVSPERAVLKKIADRSRWVVGLVIGGSLLASALIAVGATTFLDQAEERRRDECIRAQIQVQAEAGSTLGTTVLNPQSDLKARQAAFVAWVQEQGRTAYSIKRC